MSPRQEQVSRSNWLTQQTRQVVEQKDLAVSEETATAVEIEAWLQRRGVKYAPASGIPMSMIDTKRSRQNQARRDAIVPESVERFATAMRQGRVFPPIVVYPVGNRVVIVDGNNRHEAALKVKRESIQGIVIDPTTDSDTIQLLTVEANTSHGVTPSLDWRLQQAFYLCSLGHEDDVAAEAAGVTATQLGNARKAREAERRAKDGGVYGFADIGSTAKVYLNALKLEPVFLQAARLVTVQRYTVEQVANLCRAVKAGHSESEQLAIIREQADLNGAEARLLKESKKRISSPKGALASGIGMIEQCDPVALVNQIRTIEDRDEVNRRLKKAEEKLLQLMVAMETLSDLGEE
jgi:hypothetical protein